MFGYHFKINKDKLLEAGYKPKYHKHDKNFFKKENITIYTDSETGFYTVRINDVKIAEEHGHWTFSLEFNKGVSKNTRKFIVNELKYIDSMYGKSEIDKVNEMFN